MILSEVVCLAIQICFHYRKMVGLILHGRNCRNYSRCTQIRLRPLAPFLSPVVFSCLTESKLQRIVWKTGTLKALQTIKVILYSYVFRILFVRDTQLCQHMSHTQCNQKTEIYRQATLEGRRWRKLVKKYSTVIISKEQDSKLQLSLVRFNWVFLNIVKSG